MPNIFGQLAKVLGVGDDEEGMSPNPAVQAASVQPMDFMPGRSQDATENAPVYASESPSDVFQDKDPRTLERESIRKQIEALRDPSKEPQDNGFPLGRIMLNILQFSPKLGGFARAKLGDIAAKNKGLQDAYQGGLERADKLEDLSLRQEQNYRAADKFGQETTDWREGRSATSPLAEVYRGIGKKQGFDVPDEILSQMGAADLKPALEKQSAFNNEMNNRREFGIKQGNLREKMEANRLKAEEQAGTKETTALNKRFQDMGDRLSPNRRNPLLTKLQTQVNQAEALEALATQGGKPVNMNPQQMVEASRMLDSLLSQGGQATVAITNDLVPRSVGRNAAEILQWISNKPQGTNQQAFVKYMLDTAQREKEVRSNQLKRGQASSLPQYSDLKEKDPDRYNRSLIELGFDPNNDFDENGHFIGDVKAPSTAAGSTKPKTVQQNGHTYHLNEATGQYE